MSAQVEQLYREEALNRKKIFNAMEDLKVRRTGCAAAPMPHMVRQLVW